MLTVALSPYMGIAMDQAAVAKLVRKHIAVRGEGSRWARELGVSRAHISLVALGKKPPGPTILAALGLRKRVVYERIRSDG